MAAIVKDITIEQGATFLMKFNIKDSENLAVDVTGWVGRGSLKVNAKDVTSVADFVVDTTSDPTNGEVLVSMTATETDSIPTTGGKYSSVSRYQYDIELEDTDGIVYRLVNGVASVSPSITR